MSSTGRRQALAVLLLLATERALACSVSAGGVDFGGYNQFDSTHLDSVGLVTVWCEVAYSLRIDTGAGGDYMQRQMSGPAGDSLEYNLYTDYGRSLVWGDGSGGTQTVGGPGGDQPAEHYIYGRVPAGQDVRVGSYSDALTITIEF